MEIENLEKLENAESVIENSALDIPPVVIPEINAPATDGIAPGINATPQQTAVGVEAKKRGRPKKNLKNSDSATPSNRPQLSGVPQQPVNSNDAAIEPCAEILVMLTNASGMVLAQGEAGAMSKDEAMLAKNGYVAYLKAKGVDNVPAWVILAGSLSPYYLRIITTTPAKTSVASGLRKAWFGIKEFFIRRKDAHFNSRNDIKRENDISEKTRPSDLQ